MEFMYMFPVYIDSANITSITRLAETDRIRELGMQLLQPHFHLMFCGHSIPGLVLDSLQCVFPVDLPCLAMCRASLQSHASGPSMSGLVPGDSTAIICGIVPIVGRMPS